jgi:hypothetical protein
MSGMLRRPPAKEIVWPREHGLTSRQNYAAVDSWKRYGDGYAGAPDPAQMPIRVYWQDILQLNPVLGTPKLIAYSAAQPFIRTGHLRRFTRTFMRASTRFLGRWTYVGLQQRLYTERARMTGVTTRRGTSYAYARFRVAPREIQLGPGPGE